MKPPKEPVKPKKPEPPSETINQSHSVDLWEFDGDRLSYVLESRFSDIPPTELYINADYRGYDGGTIQLVRRWLAPNPNYNKEMIKYNKKLEEYEEALKDYKSQKAQFKEQLKAYCQYQLNKLGD